MARKKSVPIPMDVVSTACRFNATSRQVLQVLGDLGCKISEDTLYRHILKEYGQTFGEYRDGQADLVRLRLVRKAVSMAEEGNPTMLIFCLKNMCGWRNDPPPEDQFRSMSMKDLIVLVKEKLPQIEGKKDDEEESERDPEDTAYEEALEG